MKRRFFLSVLGLLALLCAAGPALAAAGPWAENPHARLRLVSAVPSVGEAEELSLGLQFEMPQGWKIYWRSPGDAGYPPRLDTAGSENLAELEMAWPVPHRFELFGLQTFGYEDEVVFPLTVRLQTPGQPLDLQARVAFLVCEEICVPHEEEVRLALPAGSGGSAPEAALIASYAAKVPAIETQQGLGIERVGLEGAAGAPQTLKVVARSATAFEDPDVLVEGAPGYGFDAPEVTFSDGRKRAELRLAVRAGAAAEGGLAGQELRLTLTDVDRGVEKRVRPTQTAAPPGGARFAVILGLALLGGLILNLMPCVLPVLSIKLLSVIGHGGGAPARVRGSFLATAAGVVASFLVLAAGAIALKSAGLAVGWGIQFQQPVFLAFMALIVTLFALNLFGVFEFRLPSRLSDVAVRQGGGDDSSLGGAFATGAFATLLATPCSAPFLGTAVGFALARGALEILAIFLCLGLGLAAPYLLIAAVPRLATALPKPGRWMLYLKQVLGIALAATAVWLLSVILAQSGLTVAAGVGALLLLLSLLVLLRGRLMRPVFVSALLLLSAAVLGVSAVPGGEAPRATAGDSAWQPLDRARIGELVAAGQVVFVDVTAEWCITCQANKTLVLERPPVAPALAAEEVVTMRGDWTRPSDEISTYLESFGRYGIPFNAVYGPGAPEGIALPELLTGEAVLDALERARGG